MTPFDPSVRYAEIPGFPFYRVGDDGSVWTCQKCGRGAGRPGRWRRKTPKRAGKGYLWVTLCNGDVRRHEYVHTLVLEAFVGPRPEGMEACHSPDRNPANCAATNLRWDTPSANNLDKIAHGTMPRGETHYTAKRRQAVA